MCARVATGGPWGASASGLARSKGPGAMAPGGLLCGTGGMLVPGWCLVLGAPAPARCLVPGPGAWCRVHTIVATLWQEPWPWLMAGMHIGHGSRGTIIGGNCGRTVAGAMPLMHGRYDEKEPFSLFTFPPQWGILYLTNE